MKKKRYFHVSVPPDLVGSPGLITEESSSGMGGNEKQTWPSDCWSQHESTPLVGRGRGRRGRGWYRKSEQRELSTNWNGNWSSLHNLRLMRKQQQMKPPSFSPPFSFAGPGWFSLKRHLKQCFNLLPLWVVPFRSRYSGSLASISHNH